MTFLDNYVEVSRISHLLIGNISYDYSEAFTHNLGLVAFSTIGVSLLLKTACLAFEATRTMTRQLGCNTCTCKYPTNAKGVKVSLDALDPNNNFVHIGDATTDLTGQYSFQWILQIEGKYTIIASFYSINAYYGSTAETSLGVTAAPTTPTPAPKAPVPSDYTMTILAGIVAIIIATAIVAIYIKRK